jgi:hypothetical protein
MEVDGRLSEAASAPWLRRESMLLIVTFAASGGTQSGLRQLRITGDGVRVNEEDGTGEVCSKEERREAGSGVENNAFRSHLGAAEGRELNACSSAFPPLTTHATSH